MRILISNDDGIYSSGLKALVDIFSPHNEVFVVAPDTERSAIGHAITISTPLWAEEVEFPGTVMAYKTSGTPADCVKLALRGLQIKPDLVLSGINKGANCGCNVIYSGTVSAATEGFFDGIRAFAISVDDYSKPNYGACYAHLRPLIERLLPHADSTTSLFNINLPSCNGDEILGTKITRQAVSHYSDFYEKRHCPRNREYWWLSGNDLQYEKSPDTDWQAVRQGYISVTPLQFNLTNMEDFYRLHNVIL
ncbi:5'/3'-nucleotidase SurE [Chrysiogenes arsenatis]|uniref:5'/3'-nucleotidase SurE n=1 Tax=Chrysiogenes arsenatis TaxID=309797 RepID=UPI000409F960|nr:5'/3'-nucleotidase SurE [Chrysiogenes arsenatis]